MNETIPDQKLGAQKLCGIYNLVKFDAVPCYVAHIFPR
jgi:hypothetical protein